QQQPGPLRPRGSLQTVVILRGSDEDAGADTERMREELRNREPAEDDYGLRKTDNDGREPGRQEPSTGEEAGEAGRGGACAEHAGGDQQRGYERQHEPRAPGVPTEGRPPGRQQRDLTDQQRGHDRY